MAAIKLLFLKEAAPDKYIDRERGSSKLIRRPISEKR
jgi:hypothetical protein